MPFDRPQPPDTSSLALSGATTRKLFPFAVCFDREGRIDELGEVIRRLARATCVGMPVGELLNLTRPCRSFSFEEIEAFPDQVFVAEVRGVDVTLRGQMVRSGERMLYLAFPWVSEVSSIARQGLRVSDFPPHASVVDTLMLVQTLVDKREEALAAARAKSEFLATISHELRTPLNAVLGMSELLMQTKLDVEQREFATRLKSAGEGLLQLINDVLDMSRAEAGKLVLGESDFALREVLDDAVSLVLEQAQSKGVEVLSTLDPSVPSRLRGDPVRLKQVLVNLAGNAVKFTSRGSVQIGFSLLDDGPDGVVLRGEVVDTGIGIEPETQRSLFLPFVQADGSNRRRFGGTGLGLSISRQLVELMGGRIGVESVPGQGSTFWFTLRLARAQDPVPVEEQSLYGVRVLLVGGPSPLRDTAQVFLQTWQLRCDATSPMHVLKRLDSAARQRDPYRAVLFASGDADEQAGLIGRIRAREDGVNIRLLALGARPGQGAEGLDAVLFKPVRPSQLFDTLTALLLQSMVVVSRFDEPRERSGLRALVVDDNATNRLLLVRLLRKRGVLADEVDSGRAAIARHREVGYDLVFMDVQMPEMDGYDATAQIRAGGPPTTIVAVTANAMPGDREHCLARGMDTYIAKPVRPADLDRVLSRRTPRASLASLSIPPGAALLDIPMVDTLTGDDDDLARTFLEGIAADAPRLLSACREALAHADADALQRMAAPVHELKGLVCAVTRCELASRIIKLDALVKQPTAERAALRALFDQVERDGKVLLREIDRYLTKR